MMPPQFVVSACLAGLPFRYDGQSKPHPQVIRLYESGLTLPLCPEVLGCLPPPRNPCEQRGQRVISSEGEDLTDNFRHGARVALQMALESGCRRAIVKSRSPSCGYGRIYDGTFTGTLCDGNGLWTDMLLDNGFEVYTEEDLQFLLK